MRIIIARACRSTTADAQARRWTRLSWQWREATLTMQAMLLKRFQIDFLFPKLLGSCNFGCNIGRRTWQRIALWGGAGWACCTNVPLAAVACGSAWLPPIAAAAGGPHLLALSALGWMRMNRCDGMRLQRCGMHEQTPGRQAVQDLCGGRRRHRGAAWGSAGGHAWGALPAHAPRSRHCNYPSAHSLNKHWPAHRSPHLGAAARASATLHFH